MYDEIPYEYRYHRYSSPRGLSPRCISPRVMSPRCKSPSFLHQRGCSPRTMRGNSPPSNLNTNLGSPRQYSTRPKVTTAYEKIRCNRTIRNSMLPAFIRINNSDISKYLNTISMSKTRTADTTVNESKLINSIKQSPGLDLTADGPDNNQIQNLVFDKNRPEDEILLNFNRINLTRAELLTLQPGKILPETIIDACLKCIKEKNCLLRKKRKIQDSVYCLSTNFCKYLFKNQSQLPSRIKKNLLKYE